MECDKCKEEINRGMAGSEHVVELSISVKIIERCKFEHIRGFREAIYGKNNRILGYWLLGTGKCVFSDSIEEYETKLSE